MSIRIYVGPTEQPSYNHYRAVASQHMTGYVNFFPSNADGRPASPWVVTIGTAEDWSAADADPRITNVFESELTGAEQTRADLVATLQSQILDGLPREREAALRVWFAAHGVPHEDLGGTTTLWRLFQRLIAILLERDAAWGQGWGF